LAQQTPRTQRAAVDRPARDYLVNPMSGGLWWIDYILIAAALLGSFTSCGCSRTGSDRSRRFGQAI
jgi:hypothetical protein